MFQKLVLWRRYQISCVYGRHVSGTQSEKYGFLEVEGTKGRHYIYFFAGDKGIFFSSYITVHPAKIPSKNTFDFFLNIYI